ncbi:MAG: BtrH N-terminal domain-containing protein, partial [Anaerolineae bacterium]|nr:BtrH N-terminal domain-containing protein [Anaerolineae bacterium]
FEYKGFDPWLHFITRNTLDPMPTLRERLNIRAQVRQTDNADKGLKNLTDALDEGKPALVWADMYGLPYNNMQGADDVLGIFPILVYGHDGQTVNIADRACVPLTVSAEELAKARARTASNKHRLMTLDVPDSDMLPGAVEAGIRTTTAYMLDEPPLKPMKGKFGLDAFARWADLLTSTKKDGWAKAYPGARLYGILLTGYRYINLWGTGGNGSRGQYADFLDEAAIILNKPALKPVSELYRKSAALWQELNLALLPDHIPAFKETRELIQRDYDLFIARGGDSLSERKQISQWLDAIQADMRKNFPLSETETAALRENLRERVLAVGEIEKEAVMALREVVG